MEMIEGPTLAVLTIRGDQFEFERTAQESAGTLGNRRLVVTPQMASLDDIPSSLRTSSSSRLVIFSP